MDPVTNSFLAQAASELGKAFGPDIIKAIWKKINGDNSQDSLLAKLGEEKLKKITELQQIRNDFTEYKNLKESLDPNYKGPKLWPAVKKQLKKRLKKVQSKIDDYKARPEYNTAKGDEGIHDVIKGEIKAVEQQASEAEKGIREGKIPGQQSSNPNDQRFQAYSPEQAGVLNKLSQLGLKNLESNNFDFAPIENEARAGFSQKTIPTIAERFTQFGGPGASSGQRSSAFPQLLSQAGADLERSLASMKQNYNLGRESNFLNMAQIGLKPQYGYAGPLITNGQQPAAGDKFAEWAFSDSGQSAIGNLFKGLQGLFSGTKKEDNKNDNQYADQVNQYVNENRAKGGQISDYAQPAPIVQQPYVMPDIQTPGLRNRLNF